MVNADQTVELTVSGTSERDAVAAALDAVLSAARSPGAAIDADADTTAVAIRGQGSSLESVLFELTNDLLAQLDANGAGLATVRLDGLLRTDDGYTAWGYAVGEPGVAGPPIDLTLSGVPTVERKDGAIHVGLRLRRG